jgi:nucleotide-binding universal stress UspA family protein
MAFFKKILVPTNLDEASGRAAGLAVEVARAFDATIVLLHAFDPAQNAVAASSTQGAVTMVTLDEGGVRKSLDEVLRAVRDFWPRSEALLRVGLPSDEILKAIPGVGADLVVMATHGRSGVLHAIVGSVAEKIVRHSPVPVLTVRVA